MTDPDPRAPQTPPEAPVLPGPGDTLGPPDGPAGDPEESPWRAEHIALYRHCLARVCGDAARPRAVPGAFRNDLDSAAAWALAVAGESWACTRDGDPHRGQPRWWNRGDLRRRAGSCRFSWRTADAERVLAAGPSGWGDLLVEHAVPLAALEERLVGWHRAAARGDARPLTPAALDPWIRTAYCRALVTREEDARLRAVGLGSKLPPGRWEGAEPGSEAEARALREAAVERYRLAGVGVRDWAGRW